MNIGDKVTIKSSVPEGTETILELAQLERLVAAYGGQQGVISAINGNAYTVEIPGVVEINSLPAAVLELVVAELAE